MQLNTNLIVQGDLNAKHLDYGSSESNNSGKKLKNIIENLNLKVLNNGDPTHRNATTGNMDVLDYSIVSGNLQNSDYSFEIGEDLGSDHFMLTTWLKITTERYSITNKTLIKLYHKVDWAEVSKELKTNMQNFQEHQPRHFDFQYLENNANFQKI